MTKTAAVDDTARRPYAYVDPLIDTANRRFFFLTSAGRPFGMVNLSPDTRVGQDAWKSGYRYTDTHIHWFSHVHAWQLCGIPVMPTVGELRGPEGSEAYKSAFRHETEIAQAGYHAVTLDDYDVRAELTASVRVGFHRYTFGGHGEDTGPNTTTTQPDDTAQPTASALQPGSSALQPTSASLQPTSASLQPVSPPSCRRGHGEDADPNTTTTQPDDTAQPTASVLQPGSSALQPTSASLQPTSASLQPVSPPSCRRGHGEDTGPNTTTCCPSASDAWIVFDLGAAIILPMSDAFVRRTDARTLVGYVENDRTVRRPKRTKIFFVATFDRDIEELAGWRDGERVPLRQGALAGPGVGVAARFNVQTCQPDNVQTLQLKVALSYCGIDHARENLAAELPHWDFDRARQAAHDDWDAHLSRIAVEGGTEAQRTKFYTDLFHALKGRRRVSDVGGTYLDNTGDLPRVRQIPPDEDGHPRYDHFNSDAFWGAPWSLNLLWAMAWPEITSGFCNTLVDMYKNGGLIPRGPTGGNYSFVMSCPSSTTFLVSAYMQGIRDFDVAAAYEGMRKNHGPGGMMAKAGYEHYTAKGGGVEYYLDRGYVPLGIEADAFHMEAAGTRTLEYAYHDWALAQLAAALGHEADYAELMTRSTHYRNLWDPEIRFFRPRLMDGSFLPDFDPFSPVGWEEANGHQNRWYVPHDVEALIKLLGGREAFIAELNALFEAAEATGFVAPHGSHYLAPLDYGNQPSMYIAHLFTYAGAPWLTQKWVRRIMAVAKSDITPFGGYGGDEDQGQMGCLNALMAIGLFNVAGGCHREPFYEIISPIFDRVEIRLGEADESMSRNRPEVHPAKAVAPTACRWGAPESVGCTSARTFVIETENNGPGERYIQSATLNGEPWDKPWLPHAAFAAGGTLRLVLGPEPNKEWGKDGVTTT